MLSADIEPTGMILHDNIQTCMVTKNRTTFLMKCYCMVYNYHGAKKPW